MNFYSNILSEFEFLATFRKYLLWIELVTLSCPTHLVGTGVWARNSLLDS